MPHIAITQRLDDAVFDHRVVRLAVGELAGVVVGAGRVTRTAHGWWLDGVPLAPQGVVARDEGRLSLEVRWIDDTPSRWATWLPAVHPVPLVLMAALVLWVAAQETARRVAHDEPALVRQVAALWMPAWAHGPTEVPDAAPTPRRGWDPPVRLHDGER